MSDSPLQQWEVQEMVNLLCEHSEEFRGNAFDAYQNAVSALNSLILTMGKEE